MDYIRLINDPPLDGPSNMARDEALLVCVGRRISSPALRLYEWSTPTISLGYFQHYSDYESLPPPAGALPVVRRLTGGGAILHDLELTYSLAIPADHPLAKGKPNRLYELAHDAIITCLKQLGVEASRCGVSDDSGAARGPFFCFDRRHCLDVVMGNVDASRSICNTVGERDAACDDRTNLSQSLASPKLAGSAQRRTREAILQHGSIVLGQRFAQHPGGTIELDFPTACLTVRRAFPLEFSRVSGCQIRVDSFTKKELTEASRLVEKYAGDVWKRRS